MLEIGTGASSQRAMLAIFKSLDFIPQVMRYLRISSSRVSIMQIYTHRPSPMCQML